MKHAFPEEEKQGLYRAIYERRDIRRFLPDPIPEDLLMKLLDAAHHAGSVGYMQPWNFIVIRDPEIKERVREIFLDENRQAAGHYTGERRALYDSLRLEGITEAPVNLCVTCDPGRKGPHVLGRNTMPETALFSVCCAVQNLWLAARAEGIGVGWVSILDPDALKRILNIPSPVQVVAYLCIGRVACFPTTPVLEQAGWEDRLALEDLISHNAWRSDERIGHGDR
ncbi:MAG: 5,6-dimethylbenzimidazole synthase [Nitrospirae bacterium]|nr:5,6-dimethylbenzimidazole synthase [Nitrospirota bacterium]